MPERIDADWDEFDARLKVLDKAAVDHDRWTANPSRGRTCSQAARAWRRVREQAAPESSDLFLAQLRRLARWRLINRDRNQARWDARAPAEDLTGEPWEASSSADGSLVMKSMVE
jgi:hypothetical protein